jgi:DNA-binding transcriptional LysR family regulator
MLESRRLRHFLAVFELGSIGQASEKLLLTQPALSKSLRQLEDELGVRLFDRTPLGVVPTVFGNALALHAKSIEAQIRTAEAQIASLKGKAKGHVRVGIGPSVARNIMPAVTLSVQALHPDIALSVHEGLVDDLIPKLRLGELDVVVGAWPRVTDAMFTSEVVLSDRLEVLAGSGHPLAGRRVELPDLLAHPWALPPATQKWRQALDELFIAAGLSPPRPGVVSNSAGFLLALLRAGQHLSFLPRQVMPLDPAFGIVAIDVAMARMEPEISLTFRERALLNAAVSEVVQSFRAVGADFAR